METIYVELVRVGKKWKAATQVKADIAAVARTKRGAKKKLIQHIQKIFPNLKLHV